MEGLDEEFIELLGSWVVIIYMGGSVSKKDLTCQGLGYLKLDKFNHSVDFIEAGWHVITRAIREDSVTASKMAIFDT